jgi:oligopeptide/dipeptide ABC transporter ATP-binding protein
VLGDVDLFGLSERAMQRLRGRSIALVPQDASGTLDPLRHVGAQIAEVLRWHGMVESRKAARERAVELLAQVGLPDPKRAAGAYPHELSGGMRQRALIAIAIACSPQLLIADEPTTALDVTIQSQVLDLFAQLQADLGMGLLLVTHDVGVARQIADRVAVMYAGRLVEEGPVTLLEAPAHPYTAGLLGAVPSPGTPRGGLLAIPVQPPAAGESVPSACAFAPRCSHAIEDCRHQRPELVRVGPEHLAACPVVNGKLPDRTMSSGEAP